MKLIHLSDLHIGKKLKEYSLEEDQRDILNKIVEITKQENPDAILIAGDIYDKSIPQIEAVKILDDFLVKLSNLNKKVFIISGNHDSAERLAFANKIIEKNGIVISSTFDGKVTPYTLNDEYGEYNIFMLPFVKPANVKRYFPEENIESYTDAIKICIDNMNLDTSKRNILLAHQFVTGARRSESEEKTIGGLDNVDSFVFDDFDYVALGHLHSAQNVDSQKIRYAGTPLKYSFAEAEDKKSLTVLEIKEKGTLFIKEIPLLPKHEMKNLVGKFDELTDKNFYSGTNFQDIYTKITLTDENDIIDGMARLKQIYHLLTELQYDNTRTKNNNDISSSTDVENKRPIEFFAELFESQNNRPLNEEEYQFLESIIEKAWR